MGKKTKITMQKYDKNLRIIKKNLNKKNSTKNNTLEKNASCKKFKNNSRKLQRREKKMTKNEKQIEDNNVQNENFEDDIRLISKKHDDSLTKSNLDYKRKNYFLRNNKKSKNNIKEILNDLSYSNSEIESSSVKDDFSISSIESNNDYQSDKLLETFISNSGNSRYLDPFYSFLCESETRNFLSKRNNNIILTENYDSFCYRALEESKFSWKTENLLPKIFELLAEDVKVYWKTQLYIQSYFINYIEKWQIFFIDELNRYGENYYKSKYLRIKRYKREYLYGIKNDNIYNYIMKRIISYFPCDNKWFDYWYYLQLIPKNILLSYYIVLKERNRYFLQVLSDFKDFIETVIRFGGMKGFCRKIKLIFFDKKKIYWGPDCRSKKQYIRHYIS